MLDMPSYLLGLKKGGGGGSSVTVESLSVDQNGTYTAPTGTAYSPVTVDVDPDEWHKPADWPDIESLPLPETNTTRIYYLFDCRTNIRYAGFIVNANVTKDLSIAKYQNGVIGEFSNADAIVSGQSVFMPLPNDCDYAVLRLEGEFNWAAFATSSTYKLIFWQNNSTSNQPCLWTYGKLYSADNTDTYINQTAGLNTYMLQRVRLYMSPTIALGWGFKGNKVSSIIINDGNANGGRWLSENNECTMNTPVFVYKNSVFDSNSRKISSRCLRRVDISGISVENSGSMSLAQWCQSNGALEEFIIKTNGAKISSLYYTFDGCRNLKKLDLSGCDLSECENVFHFLGDANSLTDLTLGDNLPLSIDMSACISLTHDSLVNGVIAKLAIVETTQTLTLSNISKTLLSDDEIAVATAKGWTVA